jgi:hypothetical protein
MLDIVSTFGMGNSEPAHIFCDVFQNIWLQRHLHIYRTSYPNKLSLPNVQHSLHPCNFFASNLKSIPSLLSNLLDFGLQLREPQEVHVSILLLILLLFLELKGVKGLVGGWGALEALKWLISCATLVLVLAATEHYFWGHTKVHAAGCRLLLPQLPLFKIPLLI